MAESGSNEILIGGNEMRSECDELVEERDMGFWGLSLCWRVKGTWVFVHNCVLLDPVTLPFTYCEYI